MKRTLKLLVAALMTFALVACSSNTGGVKTYKVGVAIYKYDDAFMTLYRTELENYFKTLTTDKVKYEVTIVNGNNDQNEQTNQINNFISQKYNVLIVNLVQSTAASTVITAAKNAKIPVVFINREPSKTDLDAWTGNTTYVGADARQSGKFQGEIIADLPNHGDLNGDGKVSYIMLMGDPENVDAKYRTQYSIETLQQTIPVEKLFEQRGDWDRSKGAELTATALASYGSKIEVVFANNDDMAIGAAASITSAGRTVGKDIYLVGVDALAEAQTMVQNGTMTGTVKNDHINQSHKAADVAIELIGGTSVDQYYWIDYVKVTK